MITQLDRALPITSDGSMSERFFFWHIGVTNLQLLDGVGSPEGVVEAKAKRFYMDTAGVAGAIIYVKRDDDIAGDKSQGWVLV